MKDLKTWIDNNNTDVADFAKKLGIAPVTLYQIIDGKRNPSYDVIKKLHKETNGAFPQL